MIDEENNKFDIPLQSRECKKFINLHPDWELIDEKTETVIIFYLKIVTYLIPFAHFLDESLNGICKI